MVQVPDYINRVAGVRIWRVAPNLWAQLRGLLWGPGMKEPWVTGEEYVATCSRSPDHVPPTEGCSCGIYAFYTPDLAIEGGYWTYPGDALYNRLVAGVVSVAGDVALHEWGMKAHRASIEVIFTTGAADEELPIPRSELAVAYGAEVIDVQDFEEFCAERGLILLGPEDL